MISVHHIIHDNDRDGWGSAALVLAENNPDHRRLYPTNEKDICKILDNLEAMPGDVIWVLDIPMPEYWQNLRVPTGVKLIWVDHHLAGWNRELPSGFDIRLPDSNRPTTTMQTLIDHGLVKTAGAAAFVQALSHDSPADGWGAAIDGLVIIEGDLPIDRTELRRHLASGVHGAPVPAALGLALDVAKSAQETVEKTLAAAPSEVQGNLVVIRLADAHLIPLQRYSLAARKRYPGKLTVIVHRNNRLYCGRDSQAAGIDLFRHFKARGLDPKGHPYVCTVTLPGAKIEQEIAALKKAVVE